jgi:ABC-type polysaccharide/polyol phosphate export permease
MHSRNFQLYLSFVRRELFNRYAGSATGAAWALLHPLAQLAVLSFVFSQIFRIGIEGRPGGSSYTAFVAVALWPWLMFSDSLSRGLGAVTGNGELVKKVAFPHVLLVAASVSACYLVHIAGFVAVLVALAVFGDGIRLSGLPWVLLLLVPHFLFSLGLACALAALQTFLKDVEHVVSVVLAIVFYATPIVYPASLVPERYRDLFAANPLAFYSERFRDFILMGAHPAAGDLIALAGCAVVAGGGYWLFQRLSPYFEELL